MEVETVLDLSPSSPKLSKASSSNTFTQNSIEPLGNNLFLFRSAEKIELRLGNTPFARVRKDQTHNGKRLFTSNIVYARVSEDKKLLVVGAESRQENYLFEIPSNFIN